MNMQYSQSGLSLTESFEGCKLEAYQDVAGIWTIGYGHIAGVKAGDTCTQEQAVTFLQQDLQTVVADLNRHLGVTVTQGEFDALVDFGFNLGIHAMETSTLWRLLQAGDFAGAAAQFPRWDKAGGAICEGILRRRLAEQGEFNAGQV